MARRSKKFAGVDPAYLEKQKAALLRKNRKTVLFNDQEMAAINEYCRRFKVESRSALIRKATMERVLEALSSTHPTLF